MSSELKTKEAISAEGFNYDAHPFSKHILELSRIKSELIKPALEIFETFVSQVNSSEKVSYLDDYVESDYEIIDTFKDFIFPSRITFMGDFREGNLRDFTEGGKNVTYSPIQVLNAQRKILNALGRPYDNVNVINLKQLRSEVVMTKELSGRLYKDKVSEYDMRGALPIPVTNTPFEDEWYTLDSKRAIEIYLKAKF